MDGLTFIAEMTKALAWPLAVVAIGIIFRRHFTSLFDGVRLRRIEKGEFRAEFEMVAQEILEDLPKMGKVPTAEVLPHTVQKKIEHLVGVSPLDAILQAWNQVEGKVNAASARARLARGNFPEAVHELVAKGLLQNMTGDSILGLQKLRNLAVHGPPERIAAKEAREFIALAEAAIWSMEENLRRAKS